MTLPQTICLLAMSRGEPVYLPPRTRRLLLQHGWIAPPRPFTITKVGHEDLAASPHLDAARRKLEAGRGTAKPWQGLKRGP